MKHFTLLLLSFLTVLGASAQIDIVLDEIDPPSDGGVYEINESINLSFTFFNVGVDSLSIGDSVFANYSYDNGAIQTLLLVLGQSVPTGTGIVVTATTASNLQSTVGAHEICMGVYAVGRIDADSTDNLLCNDYDLIDPVGIFETVTVSFASAYYANGDLYVTMESNQSTALEVLDVTGRLVAQHTLLNSNEVVSMDNLPQGIYVATFTRENGDTFSKKFMVN